MNDLQSSDDMRSDLSWCHTWICRWTFFPGLPKVRTSGTCWPEVLGIWSENLGGGKIEPDPNLEEKIFASWSAVMTIMSDNHERCFGLPISFLKLKVSRPKQRLRRNVTTEYHHQCDQKKIAKCLSKLPKNDFTRKMIDFDAFTKNA